MLMSKLNYFKFKLLFKKILDVEKLFKNLGFNDILEG